MPKIQDDRTEAQRNSHRYAVVATDSFMSGWGGAQGGASVAAWAYDSATSERRLLEWVESRKEMKRVRVVDLKGYRPRCAHLHIYVVEPGHPSGAVGIASPACPENASPAGAPQQKHETWCECAECCYRRKHPQLA